MRRKLRRARSAVLGVLALAVLATAAGAHEPSRINTREIVRLSGSFGALPPKTKLARDVTLTVQGKKRPFHASDWQVFALVVDQKENVAEGPEALTLQGPRDVLARIAGARDAQRVSILAERRPGSGELFVLALDLCPGD